MGTGTVTHLNPRNGVFIVRSDDGDFSLWLNLSTQEVSVGDRVRGDLDALGHEELFHLGDRCAFEVHGETGPSSLEGIRKALGG